MGSAQELPDICFTFLPTNPAGRYVGAIKKGERGYYPTTYNIEDREKARELVAYLNTEKLRLTRAQVLAMECGSHFGWEIPGASVATWEGVAAGVLSTEE